MADHSSCNRKEVPGSHRFVSPMLAPRCIDSRRQFAGCPRSGSGARTRTWRQDRTTSIPERIPGNARRQPTNRALRVIPTCAARGSGGRPSRVRTTKHGLVAVSPLESPCSSRRKSLGHPSEDVPWPGPPCSDGDRPVREDRVWRGRRRCSRLGRAFVRNHVVALKGELAKGPIHGDTTIALHTEGNTQQVQDK